LAISTIFSLEMLPELPIVYFVRVERDRV